MRGAHAAPTGTLKPPKTLNTPTLLMVPLASISGGWCVVVPYVLVSARLWSTMLRDSPKSPTFALKALGHAGLAASSTFAGTRTPQERTQPPRLPPTAAQTR